ncbi:MAG: FAD binding domain-containing protein, partial [Kiritimatiellia bacterium]|nr:FAD binding domain-containing protein [Kiritimatiellia bacterium]
MLKTAGAKGTRSAVNGMRPILVNQECVEPRLPEGAVLLDFLRRDRRLTGVKEGCREGDCGACLVLIGETEGETIRWRAVPSCLYPLSDAQGRQVVTLEGLNGRVLTPVQEALVEEGATQCGFCTPGFVIALTAYLLNADAPNAAEAERAASGNLCRCTGYLSLRRVCARLAERFAPLSGLSRAQRLLRLIEAGVVPAYFSEIHSRLRAMDQPLPEADPKAVPVGGGTDLFVQRAEKLEQAPLRLLLRHPDYRGIHREPGGWRIGGATTVEELAESRDLAKAIPGWASVFPRMASLPIRERATVAGNLVNASPIGDLSILFLAFETTVMLRGPEGDREVPLPRFFLGYKKLDRAPEETVFAIRVETPPPGARFHFEKVSRREHLDIAAVNSAALLTPDGPVVRHATFSAGGVAPIPLR